MTATGEPLWLLRAGEVTDKAFCSRNLPQMLTPAFGTHLPQALVRKVGLLRKET